MTAYKNYGFVPTVPDLFITVVGESRWKITYPTQDMINLVRKHWPFEEGLNDTTKYVEATIPREWARYKVATRNVQLCAFNAVSDYMNHILGLKLDRDDEIWYKGHPKCNESGLPQQYTLTVINDLIHPYNLGVSKVMFRKGMSLSEDMIKWTSYLEANPLAISDRSTSNKDYCQMVYGDLSHVKEVENQYRISFTDSPKGPAIVFSELASSVSASFATGGGHASYVGPRGNTSGWIIGVQIDRLENINYVNTPEHETFENVLAKELDFWQCIASDGKLMTNHRAPYVYTGVTAYQGTYKPASPPASLPKGKEVITADDERHGIKRSDFEDFCRSFPGFLTTVDYAHMGDETYDPVKVNAALKAMQIIIGCVGSKTKILKMAGCKLNELHKSEHPNILNLKDDLVVEAWNHLLTLPEVLHFYRRLMDFAEYDILWALCDEPIETMLLNWGRSTPEVLIEL